MMPRRVHLASYVLGLVLLCDQASKWWVLRSFLQTRQGIRVTPFLNFILVWNKGVTFGLLNTIAHNYMPWILAGAALLILVLLGRWLARTHSTLIALSLGAIMGGAVGNIIDRLRFGAVMDFLDFYYGSYHWYAFNIADAAIVTGVVLLLLESLVRGR
ncbi:MAG: signal peptidase II [Pseudomonadota bacterium]|nr:signal peptidase II [Pseudomonadota bacterium]